MYKAAFRLGRGQEVMSDYCKQRRCTVQTIPDGSQENSLTRQPSRITPLQQEQVLDNGAGFICLHTWHLLSVRWEGNTSASQQNRTLSLFMFSVP